MSHGFRLQAEYETGFVLTEDESDRNPYSDIGNTFSAIINNLPTKAGHGRLVRFSIVPEDYGDQYDIDWQIVGQLPAARPIYFRQMHRSFVLDGSNDTGDVCDSHNFGYQYNDPITGENVQEVIEISRS